MSRLSDTVRAGSYVLYQNAFTGTIIYGRLAGPNCTSVCRRTGASATRPVRANVVAGSSARGCLTLRAQGLTVLVQPKTVRSIEPWGEPDGQI